LKRERGREGRKERERARERENEIKRERREGAMGEIGLEQKQRNRTNRADI
jgi:hypothetical protein